MIGIMWQFEVKPGFEREFEQLYGTDGEWSILNRQTRSFLGASFMRDQNRSTRYVLIEYWSEMLLYEQYRTYRSDLIASLDAQRDRFVDSTEPVGIFTALHVPDRSGPTWSMGR